MHEKRVCLRCGSGKPEKMSKTPSTYRRPIHVLMTVGLTCHLTNSVSVEPVIKNRTFDPETRTLKKHTPGDDVEMEDTIEKKVEGLAEQIIAEDAEKRAQDLVRIITR